MIIVLSFRIPKDYRVRIRILPGRNETARSRRVLAAITLSWSAANPHADVRAGAERALSSPRMRVRR
jgi:hypothetical protein